MTLDRYGEKRDFSRTPEPLGDKGGSGDDLIFVVQMHAASHLHYDFRLELDGVLKSWAIPKGPSLDPDIKRLAMMVEDHPYGYKDFEGVIPAGNYGAGGVIVWDCGTYHATGSVDRRESAARIRTGLHKGEIKFVLSGHKLKGEFALVKIGSYKGKPASDNSWLLIKKRDAFATTEEVTRERYSVISNRTLDDLGAGEDEKDRKPIAAPPESPDPMPHDVSPMLATPVDQAFDSPEWIFEVKQDGYRAIAEINAGAVSLYSRNLLSFNLKFPSVVTSLQALGIDAVLDGEIVALDEQGRSNFQILQNYWRTGSGTICYYVFDLLYVSGRDLRRLPLLERKELLRPLLPEGGMVRYCDHVEGEGLVFFELAAKAGLEGIIAKRGDSRYLAGKRTRDWLKIRIKLQQEAIICGYTEPRGSRRYFGALVLGAWQEGELVHIGMSGGGFTDADLREIHAMLQPITLENAPFKACPPLKATWVEPVYVCQVSFSEWTEDGVMRHPVFMGLRLDKGAAEVTREQAAAAPQEAAATAEELGGAARIKFSNLDKVFWPGEGYTKRDVIDYYERVADYILPYLKDRPESLYRTPNGIAEEGFFQKEAGTLSPDWVRTEQIYSKHHEGYINYFICQDRDSLLYLANLGCIEINPWLSRIGSLDNPDYIVIDLDPEDIGFDKVVETALAVREVLEKVGVRGYPKTSGASGMHIYIPMEARYDYQTAGTFAQLIATLTHNLVPEFTSLVRSPAKRQQRVYMDYLQNRRGQTLAAPYSIRPRPGATVSTPLRWEEVKPGLHPGMFTIRTMHDRLAEVGDLFSGVLGEGVDIESCIERLGGKELR